MEGRLEPLDGLRALAALAVLVFHVWAYAPPGSGVLPGFHLSALDLAFAQLRLGVTGFFVLSGFLLYRPFAAATLRGAPPPGLARYAAGRALRILPAYWAALALVALLWHRDLDPGELLANALLLQTFVGVTEPIAPAWSLCVEVSFYVALPLLAAGVHAAARGGSTVAARAVRACAALGLLAAASIAFKAALAPGLPLALPRFLDEFAAGMVVAVVLAASSPRPAPRAAAALAGAGAALLVGLTLLAEQAVSSTQPQGAWEIVHGPLAAAALALVLAGALVGGPAAPLARVLSWRRLTALGAISYGVFLWHSPLKNALLRAGLLLPNEPLGFLWNTALVAVLSVLLAWGSWRLVERPALALRRRLTRPTPEPAAAPV